MLSFVARFLDKTRLSFHERSRFDDLKKLYVKSLGYMGFSALFAFLVITASCIVWYKGLRPSPSQFFLVPSPSEIQKNPSAEISVKELYADLTPRMSNHRVSKWVRQSSTQILNLNFAHYNEQMESSRIIFDPETFDKFKASMLSRGALGSSIMENKLISYFVPFDDAKILRAGVYKGQRIWEVEVTGLIVLSGSIKEEGKQPNSTRIKILVFEVPPSVSPYGLIVKEFLMNDYSESGTPQ